MRTRHLLAFLVAAPITYGLGTVAAYVITHHKGG